MNILMILIILLSTDGKYAGSDWSRWPCAGKGTGRDRARQRTDYYAKQAQGQDEAVDNDLMKEEHKVCLSMLIDSLV